MENNDLIAGKCEFYIKQGQRWITVPSGSVSIRRDAEYKKHLDPTTGVKSRELVEQKWTLTAEVYPDNQTGEIISIIDEPKIPEIPKPKNKSLIRRIINLLI